MVVGFGSIGSRHTGLLTARYDRVAVVDKNPDALEAAHLAFPQATLAASLDDLGSTWDWNLTLAVIATWGPSHAAIFEALVHRGVMAVLCEKPLAASVAEGTTMAQLARKENVRLRVHLHKRYSGIALGLHELEERFGLGAAQSIIVHGGARCLVTNGIHYLDFVSDLFGSLPVRVTSTATDAGINPRSTELGFYGGTAVWSYPEGRELTIAFTNGSSLTERMHLYYRDAVINLGTDDVARVYLRDTKEVERDPRVTRAGAATDLVFEGLVPGYREYPGPTLRILDELESGGDELLAPETAVDVLGALIGALVAGREHHAIELPLSPDSDLGSTRWPIS